MDTPTPHPATCPHCGTGFAPRRSWQKFDKPACRRAYHKGTGGGDLAKRVAELEERVRKLEAVVHP